MASNPKPIHRLVRFDNNGPYGMLGRLLSWRTLEDDNLLNKANISCIPTGTYTCKRTWYNKGKYETFEITGVPGRSRILFHKGNTEEDVEGCVILGTYFYCFTVDDDEDTLGVKDKVSKIGVANSKEAFGQFMNFFTGIDEWILIIEDFKA